MSFLIIIIMDMKQEKSVLRIFELRFEWYDGKGQKETAIAGERCEAQGNGSVCLCDYGNTPFTSRGGNVASFWVL